MGRERHAPISVANGLRHQIYDPLNALVFHVQRLKEEGHMMGTTEPPTFGLIRFRNECTGNVVPVLVNDAIASLTLLLT